MRTLEDVSPPVRRRRPWLIALPLVLVVAAGLAWTAFWFHAASVTRTVLAGWQENEAAAGRTYACASQDVGGFPFRFELRCREPVAALRSASPPTRVSAVDAVVVAQVWQPTLIIAEATGPLRLGPIEAAPAFSLDWSLAQASLRGLPTDPERLSVVLDRPLATSLDGTTAGLIGQADRAEFHARIAGGSARRDPVLDLALRLDEAVAPMLARAGAAPVPLDLDAVGVLRGLPSLAPRSFAGTLRTLQAAGGRLEVTRLRLQQGDIVATGTGTLGLSPRGALDGELQLSIVNAEKLLPLLGVDRLVNQLLPQSTRERLAPGLDRLVPGLGNILRGDAAPPGAGPAGGAGGEALGPATELEGKRAVRMPLRFVDGAVMLGPFRVGQLAPFY
ncbi:hypothetical protein RHODGE_RHODGE_04189 [Rhodoplanes serenus]|uniref:DUF2125 domain-containing protein n=1 Tax=Rhodoplanes serenus TaxID=200615 RepID=A0A447D0I8_9BRAD|nr:DUF2125 domain-containing protein [Rhodoplanes serenus]VCU10985.1 hypothetical protein RHODGE_RHODGE_04189 [Rhodoplanes serenus]